MRWTASSFCADRQCVEAAYVAPPFVKSTFSGGGNCVEAAYVTSSRCTSATCVEAAPDGGRVLLRDSKHLEVAPLELSRADWYDFLDAIQRGELDDL